VGIVDEYKRMHRRQSTYAAIKFRTNRREERPSLALTSLDSFLETRIGFCANRAAKKKRHDSHDRDFLIEI